jgi:hypothetical protein
MDRAASAAGHHIGLLDAPIRRQLLAGSSATTSSGDCCIVSIFLCFISAHAFRRIQREPQSRVKKDSSNLVWEARKGNVKPNKGARAPSALHAAALVDKQERAEEHAHQPEQPATSKAERIVNEGIVSAR